MVPTGKTLASITLLLALPIISCLPIEDRADDYMPRAIGKNEESVPETPPTQPEIPSQDLTPPLTYSNLEPVEFQYFVPLDPAAVDDKQNYHSYNVEDDDAATAAAAEDTVPERDDNLPDSYRPDYEALLRQYFGPKSKYFYDKDQVGIPGKENRFRRSPGGGGGGGGGGGASSGSYSQASSSSSAGDSPIYFGNQGGFGGFDSGFGQAGFGGGNFGSQGAFGGGGFGGYNNGGYGQGGFGGGNQGYSGSQSSSSASSQSGGGGGGYGGGSDYDAGYGGGHEGNYGGGHDDGNILLRIGGSEDDGPSVGGSGTTNAKGVFSASSSSIDSNGKATYSVKAGKF